MPAFVVRREQDKKISVIFRFGNAAQRNMTGNLRDAPGIGILLAIGLPQCIGARQRGAGCTRRDAIDSYSGGKFLGQLQHQSGQREFRRGIKRAQQVDPEDYVIGSGQFFGR